MPAGLNRVCELITFSYLSDDSVGGAVPSGTVVYPRLSARIEQNMPVQALLDQGVQTVETFQVMLFPGNIEVKHNDQIRFIAPVNGDWFYDKKFRVIGLTRSSSHPMNDRNLVKVIVRRWEESHGESYQ